MKILVLGQNYRPEERSYYVHELTTGLLAKGHEVFMLTAFPHYGRNGVYEGYQGRIFQRETIDGVQVIRCWVYAGTSKAFCARLISFASFCFTSLLFGLFAVPRVDIVYTSI